MYTMAQQCSRSKMMMAKSTRTPCQTAAMYQIPREDYSLHNIGQENFKSKARKELIAEPTMTGSP
jgi:hypothetical protein